jgi:predicted PurR-regulated permease PerM
MEKEKINISSRVFLIGLLGLSFFASLLIFRSFIGEILVATILVSSSYGLYQKFVSRLKGRRMLASFLMCFIIVSLVILPLAGLVGYSAQRLVSAYGGAEQYFNEGNFSMLMDRLSESSLAKQAMILTGSDLDAKSYILEKGDEVKEWFLSGAGNDIIFASSKNILSSTASTIFSIVIVIFCMFFFFVDGEKMLKKLKKLTPLPSRYDMEIFNKFRDVSYSILFSTFATAIVQGFLGAIGFLIIGFPAFFASIILAFSTIIPYVGTALVWVPISLYLFATGQIWQGVFLIIWGAVIIGNSDNILKAYLIKDKAGVHPLFVFFSIVGGLTLFGFWGLMYGPLIVSLTVTVLHIYELEFSDSLEEG